MLGEISVVRHDGFEFVVKEEEQAALLYSFKDGLQIDCKALPVNWIVYLSYCKKYDLLLGASYGEGKVFAIKVKNGCFTENICVLDEGGRSHAIILDKDEKFAYSANLGKDKIVCYEVDDSGLSVKSSCVLAQKTGPRHMIFNKMCNVMYCVSEFSNEVFVLQQEKSTGVLSILQVISVLPEGYLGESYGGTLIIQEDNRYLYVTNRGANTIALCEISENGLLKKIADLDMRLMDFYKSEKNVYGV